MMKLPPAFSNQYAASARRPAMRMAERSFMPTPTTRERGLLLFSTSPTVNVEQSSPATPPGRARPRRLRRIVDDVTCGRDTDPTSHWRRCQNAAGRSRTAARNGRSRFVRRMTILGVRKHRAPINERLETRAIKRREAIHEIGAHLFDRDHQDQLRGRRHRRRLAAGPGRRRTAHHKQGEKISAHDVPIVTPCAIIRLCALW